MGVRASVGRVEDNRLCMPTTLASLGRRDEVNIGGGISHRSPSQPPQREGRQGPHTSWECFGARRPLLRPQRAVSTRAKTAPMLQKGPACVGERKLWQKVRIVVAGRATISQPLVANVLLSKRFRRAPHVSAREADTKDTFPDPMRTGGTACEAFLFTFTTEPRSSRRAAAALPAGPTLRASPTPTRGLSHSPSSPAR